jgi:hypothetical protein
MLLKIHQLPYEDRIIASQRFHLYTGASEFDYPLGILTGLNVIDPINEDLYSTVCCNDYRPQSLMMLLNRMGIATVLKDGILHLSIAPEHPWYRLTVPTSHPSYGNYLVLEVTAYDLDSFHGA